MVIRVNRELCAGCGVCADVCPDGAIQMVDQRAMIVESLCSQCEACVDACPNGAITALAPLSTPAVVTGLPVTESSLVPAQMPAALVEGALPEITPAGRGLAPLAGAALAFVGREVAPRLADVLLNALERRLTRPATGAITPQWTSSRSFAPRGKGDRRRLRYRRGHVGMRMNKERR